MNIVYLIHIICVFIRFDFAIISFCSSELISIIVDTTRLHTIHFDADFEYGEITNV